MNLLKPAVISYALPVLAVLAVTVGYDRYARASNASNNHMCKHQFALCTSALCIPQPGDPTKAICFCDVEEGVSLSSVPCGTTLPSTDSHGIRTVYSAYSPKQFLQGKKGMKCPSGTPWSWCLNKICTVDPTNAKKAICICDVVRSPGEWTTLGGDCDTSSCKTAYWSGATIEDMESATNFLLKGLGLKESPIKWCK